MRLCNTQLFFIVFISSFLYTNAQVGIGTTSPSDAAMLDVNGGNASDGYRGFMPPRVPTTAERDAIPVTGIDVGLQIFVMDIRCLQIWNGNSWEDIKCLNQNVWLNEFHYDNIGGDTGEFIEIAGNAGVNLSGYTVYFVNGNTSTVYSALGLSGTIQNESNGFGALSFSFTGIQNGSPDGIALEDADGNLLQFISYEGTITAGTTVTSLNGQTSTDVGVQESDATTAIGESLQLTGGPGSSSLDFNWSGPVTESPGLLNSGQTFN